MAAYFFDTSALVKRYATETGTAWTTGLLDPVAGHRIYVARIAGVECVAALTRKVRGHHLTAADAATAIVTLLEANSERTGLKLPALTLVSADVELLAAGAAEGVTTDNPNTH